MFEFKWNPDSDLLKFVESKELNFVIVTSMLVTGKVIDLENVLELF